MKATQEQSWTEVTQLFEAALELLPDERNAFLERACAGDEKLRCEVQSLLDADVEAGQFMKIHGEQETSTAGATLPSEDGATEPSVDVPEEELKPGSPLGRYVVRERLGAGGMGVVYEAYDPELNRKIAIKLVRPGASGSISASEGRARLMREAQAMAQLSHPNVIAVHDVGTFGDQVFIAMEYVEGRTLTHWLAEQKRPWRAIVNMFVHTGRGLAAAHAAGILHRDFKPDNVLVGKDGRPRVLDFGLARALFGEPEKGALDDELAKADADGPSNLAPLAVVLTRPGRLMGTPAYMAPEQLMGERVDEKADQYSFCAALFQGLYGILPFNPDNFGALLEQIRLRKVNEVPNSNSVPPSVHRALLRGLSPNPVDRFSSMEALLEKLERQRAVPRRQKLTVAGFVVVMSILGALFYTRHNPRVTEKDALVPADFNNATAIKSMAVLPFVNASADPINEYLPDGITEDLIDHLSQIPDLRVIARSTAFRYKGKEPDFEKLKRELHVDAVLTGSVRQRADALVIHAELISLATGLQLWGKRFDRNLAQMMEVQEEITKAVFEKLPRRLTVEAQHRVTRRYTENAAAYQLYLRGRYFWNKRTPEGLSKAVDYFDQALKADPEYALAYAGLADSYVVLGAYNYVPQNESYNRAEAAASKALKLDDGLAEAHTSLAAIKELRWDWVTAENEYKRALKLNSNYATAHQWYGEYLQTRGRLEEALFEVGHAEQLDPQSVPVIRGKGMLFCEMGRFDRGVAALKEALQMDPSDQETRMAVGFCHLEQKMYQEAVAELQEVCAASDNLQCEAWLSYAYAKCGKRVKAQSILVELQKRDANRDAAVPIALVYTALDNKGSAFEWLEKAYQRRSHWLPILKNTRQLDGLRSDPRFGALLQRIESPP